MFILIFFMMLGPLQEGKRSLIFLISKTIKGENFLKVKIKDTSIINIKDKLVSNQYMGTNKSFFFTYIAKKNVSKN